MLFIAFLRLSVAVEEGCDGAWWGATPHSVRVAHLHASPSAVESSDDNESPLPALTAARWFGSPFTRDVAPSPSSTMLYGGVLDTLRVASLTATSVLSAADVAFPIVAAASCLGPEQTAEPRSIATRIVSARDAALVRHCFFLRALYD